MLHLDSTVLSFDVSPSKVADRSPDWSRASSHSIDKFQDSVLQSLAPFNPCVSECLSADCSSHLPYLDEYAQNLVTSIVSCASHCIPSRSSSNTHRLPGWKDGVHLLRRAANFWYKVWNEASYSTSCVLFQLKKNMLKVVLSMVYTVLSADILIWCDQKLLAIIPFLINNLVIFGLSFIL